MRRCKRLISLTVAGLAGMTFAISASKALAQQVLQSECSSLISTKESLLQTLKSLDEWYEGHSKLTDIDPMLLQRNRIDRQLTAESLGQIEEQINELKCGTSPNPMTTPSAPDVLPTPSPGPPPDPDPSPNDRSVEDESIRQERLFLEGLINFLTAKRREAIATQEQLERGISILVKAQNSAQLTYQLLDLEFEAVIEQEQLLRMFVDDMQKSTDTMFTLKDLGRAVVSIRKALGKPVVPTRSRLHASTHGLINALNARSDAFDGPFSILQNQVEDWAGTGDLGWERLIGLSYEVTDILTDTSMEIAERRLQASNILAKISQHNGKALQLKRTLATENQKTIHGFDNSIALVRTRLQELTSQDRLFPVEVRNETPADEAHPK